MSQPIFFAATDVESLTPTAVMLLLGRIAADKMSSSFPDSNASMYLDHLEVQLENIVTAVSVTAWLTWDATGDEFCQPATVATISAGATAGKGAAMLGIDSNVRFPTGKTLYLWLKVDAGTADVTVARLYWL